MSKLTDELSDLEFKKEHKCSICGRLFTGWGNNPYPVTKGEDDVCCDECNEIKVIPARLRLMEVTREK